MGRQSKRQPRILRPVQKNELNDNLDGLDGNRSGCCGRREFGLNNPQLGLGTGPCCSYGWYNRTLFGSGANTCCGRKGCCGDRLKGPRCNVNLQCGWAGGGID